MNHRCKGRLSGRVAIVTGASRRQGIGTAICRALADEGADVFFTHWKTYDQTMEWGADHDWPTLLCEELSEKGVHADHFEGNLADPQVPSQLFDRVEAKLGVPTILINNATHSTEDGWKNLNAEGLDNHYAVNVRGTSLLCVEFAKRLDNQWRGSIVNMVSGQDKEPQPKELAYAATKGAISAFTRSLAAELSPLRITVNAVDPGPTDTGWVTEALKKELLARSPMGRLGRPEDVAKLVTFLASEDAAWITGQIIHSDGGFR
ncbi:SDR family oxidoreductase [Salinithrix halophila]|uniref:SDR family oxidoreductase n=1 Tax=Salinithrix halophila TaxID=1485204 RepID=A0ABV8J906_9BACL